MDTDPEVEKPKNRAEKRKRVASKRVRLVRYPNWRLAVEIRTTKTPPWVKKRRSRRRSKMARASRKANR